MTSSDSPELTGPPRFACYSGAIVLWQRDKRASGGVVLTRTRRL